MTIQAIKPSSTEVPRESCDLATRVTKSLLGYGVIAGPIYVGVSLAQALTRSGFSLARDEWSLLANGGLGWIQITNFVVTGLMTVAAAAGLRRALRGGRGGAWAPGLIGVYGVGLISAGVFRADPAMGFPPGTPPGAATVSWHGMAHLASAGIGFACVIAACFVVARRLAAEGHRGWASYSRGTGIMFLAGFAAVASGAGGAVANVVFTVSVVAAWAWVSALSVHLYRRAARATDAGPRAPGQGELA
jgi:hypothetical protein